MFYSKQGHPNPLRRVRFNDPDIGRKSLSISNHLNLEPHTVCELFKMCLPAELCFEWIKQHLRIKAFLGIPENAVKRPFWITLCTCVLVVIV